MSKGLVTDLFDHIHQKRWTSLESWLLSAIHPYCGSFRRFEMILLRLTALVLGAGLQMQQQPAPAPAPVTAVIAMTSLKPGVAQADVMKLVPDEVHVAVQIYLEGKIDQWYTRGDGKGAVILLHCNTEDQAKAILSALPFVKAGYLDVEYIPVGPFQGLRIFPGLQPASDGAALR
jgi:hypothetical protein